MTQILGTKTIKRIMAPGQPVKVPFVENVSHEGLRTPRLILRSMSTEDTPDLARVIQRDAAHLFQWLPKPEGCTSSKSIAAEFIRKCTDGDSSGQAWRRLAVGPGGTIVGGVNVIRIERGLNWQADVNWWVGSTHYGQGYATEIISAALTHAFGDLPTGLGLHRVHAGIQPGNAASIRVAQKAGFVPDPALDSQLLVNGEWQLHRGFVARI